MDLYKQSQIEYFMAFIVDAQLFISSHCIALYWECTYLILINWNIEMRINKLLPI